MPRKTAAGAFFKGTAVAVLDASLSQVLGWTWFISSPGVQAQGPPPLTLTLTLLYPRNPFPIPLTLTLTLSLPLN